MDPSHMHFVQSDDPQQILDQIRQFLGISEPNDERIREIILDFHAVLENSLQEIICARLAGLILVGDRADAQKSALREQLSRISFAAKLEVLSPILLSWYDKEPILTLPQEDEYSRLVGEGKTREAEKYKASHGDKSDIVQDLKDINAIRNKAAHDPNNCRLIGDWRSSGDIAPINKFAFKCACLNMDLHKIIENA